MFLHAYSYYHIILLGEGRKKNRGDGDGGGLNIRRKVYRQCDRRHIKIIQEITYNFFPFAKTEIKTKNFKKKSRVIQPTSELSYEKAFRKI